MAKPETYLGPDFRTAIAGGFGPIDPLLHPDPHLPPLLYRVVVGILRRLLPILFRIRIDGLGNLPPPPYILASNHQRWFDPALLAMIFPVGTMVYSMAKRETVFNRGWKRAIVRRLGVFAISPQAGELDVTGVSSVYHVLNRGGVVLIFPEGRYSRGGALRPLKKGVGHFALQAGVPVVPVVLHGVDRLRPFGVVTLTVEPPIRPDPPRWWEQSRRIMAVVEQLRESFQRVVDRSRRGSPRPERRWRRQLRRLRARLPGHHQVQPPP